MLINLIVVIITVIIIFIIKHNTQTCKLPPS